MVAEHDTIMSSRNDKTLTFVLDNAAATYTCGDRHAFVHLEKGVKTLAWFDNSTRTADGLGTLLVAAYNTSSELWQTARLSATYFVGAANLLSQRRLFTELGLRASVSHDQRQMTLMSDDNQVQWSFVLDQDGLYNIQLRAQEDIDPVLATSAVLPLDRWHARFAHAQVGVVKAMARNNAVIGMNLTRDEAKRDLECISCECAKKRRMSYQSTNPKRATAPFETVVMDLAFSTVATPSGATMILHVVDEATRSMWLYLQSNKTQTLSNATQFFELANEQYNSQVKVVRTDQGGEFKFSNFDDLCGLATHHEFAHAHAHKEVCLVEKAHAVIFGKIRALLVAAGQPDAL